MPLLPLRAIAPYRPVEHHIRSAAWADMPLARGYSLNAWHGIEHIAQWLDSWLNRAVHISDALYQPLLHSVFFIIYSSL